jgi:hypothetical protein
MKWFLRLWLIWACLCLVGSGLCVYAVVHFIQKFW